MIYLGPGAGGWVNEIAIDPVDEDMVYVGGDNLGFCYSHDGARTWKRPMGAYGRQKIWNYQVAGTWADPLTRDVWVATGGGPFKSTDHGVTWTFMGGTGFPEYDQSAAGHCKIASLYTHPANSNLVFLGAGASAKHRTVGTGKWIHFGYRSIDGGLSWSPFGANGTPPSQSGDSTGTGKIVVSHMAFEFADQAVIYLATNQGLFKSTGQGSSWAKLTSYFFVRSVVVARNRPELVLFSVYGSGGLGQDGTYVSTNRGVDFTRITSGPNSSSGSRWLQMLDDDGTTIVAERNSRLVKSTDSGDTWSYLTGTSVLPEEIGDPYASGGDGTNTFMVGTKNNDLIYHTGSYLVTKSIDGGSTWSQTYGTRWPGGRYSNNGFTNTVVKDFIIDHPTLVMVDPDVGLMISTDDGVSWENYKGLHGYLGATACCQDDDYYYALLGSMTSGNLYRASKSSFSNNDTDWSLYTAVGNHFDGKLNDETDMSIFRSGPREKMFVQIWGRDTENWDKGLYVCDMIEQPGIFTHITSVPVAYGDEIVQDPNDPDILYAGFTNPGGYLDGFQDASWTDPGFGLKWGGVYRSTDFGATWQKIDDHTANGSDVYAIAVRPGDSDVLFKGIRGWSSSARGGVWRTTNGTAPSPVWTKIMTNVTVPFEDSFRFASQIIYHSDGYLYVMLRHEYESYHFKGLYRSDDDGDTWESLDVDGINNRIDELIPDPVDPKVFWMGTDGTAGVEYRLP